MLNGKMAVDFGIISIKDFKEKRINYLGILVQLIPSRNDEIRFPFIGDPPDSEIPTSLYPEIVTQPSGRKVAVVQAYAYTKYLGVLNLKFDANGELAEAKGNPIVLDYKIKENQEVLDEIKKWRVGIDNITKQEIGKTKVLLDGWCRFYECNMGNLITDAFIDYVRRECLF